MKYSDAQIKILKDVYDSEDGIVLTGVYKRTVEILTQGRLVSYRYVPSKSPKSSDNLEVKRAESPRLVRKALNLIQSRDNK